MYWWYIIITMSLWITNPQVVYSESCYKVPDMLNFQMIGAGTYSSSDLSTTDTTLCGGECFAVNISFFAVWKNKYCFCINDISSLTNVTGDCTTNDGFRVNAANSQDVTHVFQLKATSTNIDVNISKLVTFTTEQLFLEPSQASVGYQYSYSDRNQIWEYNGDQTGLQRTFFETGIIEIRAQSVKSWNKVMIFEVGLEIYLFNEITGLNFTCQPVAITYLIAHCTLRINSGNGATGKIYVDGVERENFQLPESPWERVGSPVNFFQNNFLSTSGMTGKFILNAVFQYEGVVSHLEVVATVAGAIKVVLLQPSCTSQFYCLTTSSCSADQDCSLTRTCPNGLCSVSRSCADSCDRRFLNKNNETQLPLDYIVKELENVNLILGYNIITLTTPWAVGTGYRLGFSASVGGIVAATTTRNWESPDFQSNTGTYALSNTETKTNFVPIYYQHQITAVGQSKLTGKFKIMFNSTGTKIVRVELKSASNAIVNSESSVVVGFNINDTSFHLPHFAVTNEAKLFALKPHTGDLLQYYWVFGDGQVANTTSSSINHTFTTKGQYNVTVISYNILTSGTETVLLTVMDRVSINRVDGASAPVSPNSPLTYTVVMNSGSNFNCTLSGQGISPNITQPESNLNYQVQWPSDSYYKVELYCKNEVTSDIKNFTQIVLSNITGLKFSPLGGAYNEDTSITFKWDSGINITFTFLLNNISYPLTFNETLREGKTGTFRITSLGNLIGVLRAVNLMSDVILVANLTFSERVVNLRIVPDKQYRELGKSIIFTILVDKGSSMKFIIDLNDGNNHTEQIAPEITYTNNTVLNHTYASPGNYNATVTSINTAGTVVSSTEVYILEVLGVYKVHQPMKFYKRNTDTSFSLNRTSGAAPVMANLTINWQDGSPNTVILPPGFNESANYIHSFATEGIYNCNITIQNPISKVELSVEIVVMKAISNFRYTHTPLNTWTNNVVKFEYLIDDGDRVMFTLDPGAGQTAKNFNFGNVTTTNNKYEFTHSYPAIGSYSINATACNELGCQSKAGSIVIQYKIIRAEFTITTNQFVETGNATTITINWSGTNFPTGMSVTVVYADGSSPDTFTLASNQIPYTHSKVITKIGRSMINVTLFNLANTESYTYEIGVFDKFQNFEVGMKWGPARSDPFGAAKNRLPINQIVYFSLSVGKGTVERYEFFYVSAKNISDIYYCNVTVVNQEFTHIFTTLGDYNVSILAVNPLDRIIKSYSLSIGGSMKDTRIILPTQTLIPNVKGQLRVVWTAIDSSACICIDLGNFTKRIYGATSGCTNCSDYTYANEKPINNELKINIRYPKEGDYNIKVFVYNDFESTKTNHTLAITRVDCNIPVIHMSKYEYTQSETPQLGERGSQIIVEAKIDEIPCQVTKLNYKKWSAVEVDSEYFRPIRSIDLSRIETYNNTQLIIPERYMSYGLYKLMFTVTMDTNITIYTFVNFNFTYLRVGKSPVSVLLSNGGINLFVRSNDAELCFFPEKYSVDPDLDKQNFLNWTWFWTCQEKSEIRNTTNMVTPKSKGYSFPSIRTGCFGDGPGYINFTDKKYCLWTGNMLITKSYEYEVIGTSGDGRKASSKVSVEVIFGTPPTINIQCMRPKMCKIKTDGPYKYQEVSFNPSDDLLINASCIIASGGDCVFGKWELILYNSSLSDWVILEDSEAKNYIKGIESLEMSLLSTFWIKYTGIERFKACYKAAAGTSNGKSCIQFFVVPLPNNVYCKLNSTVMKQTDVVCMTCNETTLYDYRIYVNNTGQLTTLGFNKTGLFCSIIPYSENLQEYRVRITNSNGGFLDLKVADIAVNKLNMSEMESILKDLESGNSKELDMVNAKGDFKKMSEIYLKYISVITVSSQNTMMDVFGSATNNSKQSFGGSGYNSKLPTENVITIKDLSVEKRTIYEGDRDKKSALINKMTRHLNDMVPGDIQSLYLISGVIESITTTFDNLNREGQGQVANKLVHLSQNLKVMSNNAPRDDIFKISTSIMTASLLSDTASNTQIDSGIKRDIKEAKDNFLDYDTNLLSNSKSFVGVTNIKEADNSLTLETNSNYQSKVATGIKSNNINTMTTVTKVLRDICVIDDKPIELDSSHMQYMLMKTRGESLTNKQFNKGRSQIILPNICEAFGITTNCNNPNNPISVEILATPNNVRAFMPNPNGAGLPIPMESETFTVNMYMGGSSNEQSLKNSKSEGFKMMLSRDPTLKIPDYTYSNQTAIAPGREIPGTGTLLSGPSCYYQKLVVHEFTLEGKDQSVHFQIEPKRKYDVQYLIVGRLSKPPSLQDNPDGTKDPIGFSFWGMLPHKYSKQVQSVRSDEPDPWTYFVSNSMFESAKKTALDSEPDYSKKRNTLYFGIRQLRENEYDLYTENNKPKIPYQYNDQINVTYSTRIFSSGCYHTDEKANNAWDTSGCVVGPLTTPMRTQCICKHLTSFAGGWIVAPNTIDFDYVFSNFDFTKNLTLFVTEIVIFVVFTLIMVWARRQDIKDIEKIGVTPMADNEGEDKYLYEIVVDTSIRKGAGTNSNIVFILSGEYDETEARKLEDDKRPILKRGNVDRFLMAVPRSLGNLQYIRLWHDNSGKGSEASWFCNYFGVTDLQTKEKFHFLVNRWFAVEEDDGQIDRLIAVASVEELLNFNEVFTRKMKADLSEDHLWLSIMARPPESRFTRLERVACCLLLLFLTMLTTCMFYESEGPSKKEKTIMVVGPFALTPKEVWTGLVSNLISFIPLFVIIELFRRSQLKQGHANKLRKVVEEHLGGPPSSSVDQGFTHSTADLTANEAVISSRPDTPGYRAPDQVNVQVIENDNLPQMPSNEVPPKKKIIRKRLFPWWVRIIVWCFLSFLLVVAALFTTFYGIQFGDDACKKWITSMFISFFSSVLLTQPLKVIMMAMFFSLVCRKTDKLDEVEFVDEEDELMNELGQRNGLNRNEEFLHGDLYNEPMRPSKHLVQPPMKEDVEKAREIRLREMKMFDVLREILFYTIYFCTLLLVTYSLRDSNSFQLKIEVERVFTVKGDYDFNKIRKEDQFWEWGLNVLVPALRAPKWYNNDPQIYQRGFTSDRSNRLIGYAVMRQVRVKKGTCQVYKYIKHLINECNSPYSTANEDTANYTGEWGDYPKNNSEPVEIAFTYKTPEQLDGLPYLGRITYYGGGGYVHEFSGSSKDLYTNFMELRNKRWIDAQTRAIFIEFTTYNPNVNLFTVNTFLIEMPGSGGMWPSYRIEPANLLGLYSSGVVAFEIFCQVLYGIFIIFMIVKEIRNLIKEKWSYFSQFWNICEVFLIIGSFACVAAFAYVKIATGKLTDKFSKYGGLVYIKFQYVAFWNEYLSYLVSFIVFIATLKFIKLLRFNKRMGMLGAVLRYSAKDMKQFFIIFAIMFLAFVMVFYSLFMDSLYRYHTFLHATEASMQIALGKFEFLELYQKEPIFGPIVFAFYVIFIIFVMLNMFIAILNEGFAVVRADIELQDNDYELVDFVMTKFIVWTGISQTRIGQKLIKTGVTDQIYRDIDTRQMAAKVNSFPDKVDQLLNHINRIITNNDPGNSSKSDSKSFSSVLFEKPPRPKIKGGDEVGDYDERNIRTIDDDMRSSRPASGSSNILRQRNATHEMTPIEK